MFGGGGIREQMFAVKHGLHLRLKSVSLSKFITENVSSDSGGASALSRVARFFLAQHTKTGKKYTK
jgi:hypothetical protein